MAEKTKIAIIGSGLGGLSASIYLAVKGYEVHVYEQGNKPGGKANELRFCNFRFDTGPSLLTMPFVLKELFEYAGKNIEDYIRIKRLDILCKYFYPDETILNAFSDINKLADEINLKTKDSVESIKKYLDYSKKIYELTSDMFLFNSFSKLSNFTNFKSLKTLFQLNKIDPFRSMHQANSGFFEDEKTIQLFDRYATYNGSSPFKAPATLNVIQHVEYNLGGYIAEDGIYSVVKALHNLAEELDVKFIFMNRVDKIVTKNSKAVGLVYGNEFVNYDAVLSNSDVLNTYHNILDTNPYKESNKYNKAEPSSSALVFYWGINTQSPELEIHNILFAENYKKEFDDIFERKTCPEDPTVYIYISSKFKKSDAPEGNENWFVMINTPYDDGQDWDKEIEKSKERILNKINKILGIDLKDKIVCERILTPQKIENDTSSTYGSIYGISSNSRSAAFKRQQNKSKSIEGLYFCGGSAHPGGGIPLVILSGKTASELITKYHPIYD